MQETDTFIGFSKSTIRFPILGFIAIHIESKGYNISAGTGGGGRVRSLEMVLKENKIVTKYKMHGSSNENNLNILFWGLEKSG